MASSSSGDNPTLPYFNPIHLYRTGTKLSRDILATCMATCGYRYDLDPGLCTFCNGFLLSRPSPRSGSVSLAASADACFVIVMGVGGF